MKVPMIGLCNTIDGPSKDELVSHVLERIKLLPRQDAKRVCGFISEASTVFDSGRGNRADGHVNGCQWEDLPMIFAPIDPLLAGLFAQLLNRLYSEANDVLWDLSRCLPNGRDESY